MPRKVTSPVRRPKAVESQEHEPQGQVIQQRAAPLADTPSNRREETRYFDVPEPPSIDVEAAKMKEDGIAFEKFMNEKVCIRIHAQGVEGEQQVVPLWVNERCQPVVRNVPTWVRRCFVEVLIHARVSTYRQQSDPREPDNIQNIETVSYAYPFAVEQDTQEGRAWAERLMAQPA